MRYLQQKQVQAQVVPTPSGPAPPGCAHVKSLVFVVSQRPVLLVLQLQDRVDERKVAQHLGRPRQQVRLASPDEAQALTGYAVGAIPPFGHQQPLRTLVDARVSQHASVCGGGGEPGVSVVVGVPDLLAMAQAEVTDIVSGAPPGGPGARPVRLQPLPLAVGGGGVVHMVATAVLRRRVAKMLLFVSLVPENTPTLPRDGRALHLRRVWAHPDPHQADVPVEVQLICGKTLERNLGRQSAEQLLDRIRPGAVMAVAGHIQTNPARPGSNAHRHVIDIVAHNVCVLRKSRSAGHELARVEELDWFQPAHPADQGSSGGDAAALADAPSAAPVGPGAALAASTSGVMAAASPAACEDTPEQLDPSCYSLPLPDSAIKWVQDAAGVRAMRAALFPAPAVRPHAPDATAAAPPVCGIDCEWVPFERGQPKSPVALLQLALRDRVFLCDLLAICQPQLPREHPQQQHPQEVTQPPEGAALGEAQAELAGLLAELAVSREVVTCGFQLAQDLQRLQESYPAMLPWFTPGKGNAVTIVNHVDIRQLATAHPGLEARQQPSLSQLVAAVTGAPLDKQLQCSDWARRPLSRVQRTYAANDAHCLTVLYDALAPAAAPATTAAPVRGPQSQSEQQS